MKLLINMYINCILFKCKRKKVHKIGNNKDKNFKVKISFQNLILITRKERRKM